MHYTIEKFDQLITSIATTGKPNGHVKQDEIGNLLLECSDEKEKIRLHIMEEVFNASEEKSLLLLIDKYQCAFIRLMDQIHLYKKNLKKQDEYFELAKMLFDYLNELLCFLQIHYAKYFNHSQKMPLIKTEHFIKELAPKTELIATVLKKTILHEKLIRHIIQPMEALALQETITYDEATYIKLATAELISIDYTSEAEDIVMDVKKLLIRLNYNQAEISAYYINETDLLVSEEESVQGKLRILKYNQKEINQITVKPNCILFADKPGLKEQLTNWLIEEIYFYEMEQTIAGTQPPAINSEAKIHTSLSVPQLALLFRLMKEEQVITNSNQSELLKMVANNFTTMQKENFSYGHLHGKYYKIEANTKRAVYDMLMKLLNLSRKIG